MDHGLPGSSVHGMLQARILEWVAISFSSAFLLLSATLLVCSTLFFSRWAHKSVLYVCISIPALQIDSSVPFFWIPDMCVNVYLLLSGLLHSVCIMITSQFLSKPGALSWLRYPAYSTFYLYVCWHVKALQNCPESNFGFPSFHL